MNDDNHVKVVDKRSFTSDGELKDEHDNTPEVEEKNDTRETESPSETKKTEPGGLPPKLDFSSFIVSLYTSGAISLGLINLPDESSKIDLPSAKQTIDLLEILKEKTDGNLTARESKLLEDLLAQLQLAFVNQWEKERS